MQIAIEFKTDPALQFLSAIQPHIDEASYNRLVGIFFQNFFTKNPAEIWNPDVMRQLTADVGISSESIDKSLNTMTSDENQKKLEKNFHIPSSTLSLFSVFWLSEEIIVGLAIFLV